MDNIWCFIIPLLTAILGWLLRHLTCKGGSDNSKEIEDLKLENADLKAKLDACLDRKNDNSALAELEAKNAKLKADLDACFSDKKSLEATIASGAGSGSASTDLGIASGFVAGGASEPSLNFDAAAAKAAIGKKVVADDLKIVEGIGPKIEQLFHNFGIKTWYQLSEASIEKCQEVLNSGGKRYEIHNPGTWPMQSKLAFEGKWEELNKLQDELDGGKFRK